MVTIVISSVFLYSKDVIPIKIIHAIFWLTWIIFFLLSHRKITLWGKLGEMYGKQERRSNYWKAKLNSAIVTRSILFAFVTTLLVLVIFNPKSTFNLKSSTRYLYITELVISLLLLFISIEACDSSLSLIQNTEIVKNFKYLIGWELRSYVLGFAYLLGAISIIISTLNEWLGLFYVLFFALLFLSYQLQLGKK